MTTVTGEPFRLEVNSRRQQLGSGTAGVTVVGGTEYSEPASVTETVTGPPVRLGENERSQVDGCPMAEKAFHEGGARFQVDRLAVKVSLHEESFIPFNRTTGGE